MDLANPECLQSQSSWMPGIVCGGPCFAVHDAVDIARSDEPIHAAIHLTQKERYLYARQNRYHIARSRRLWYSSKKVALSRAEPRVASKAHGVLEPQDRWILAYSSGRSDGIAISYYGVPLFEVLPQFALVLVRRMYVWFVQIRVKFIQDQDLPEHVERILAILMTFPGQYKLSPLFDGCEELFRAFSKNPFATCYFVYHFSRDL